MRTAQWSTIANRRFDASNGTNGEIKAYVYDGIKNVIYCAGKFTLVRDTSNGDLSANNIAVWDVTGKCWSLLGTPLYNGTQPGAFINALAMDSSNQILYVGGEFRTVYDNSNTTLSNTNYVASWDAKNKYWSRIGTSSSNNGVDASVNALVYSNNTLFVGGNFTYVSYTGSTGTSLQSKYVSMWNTKLNTWSVLGLSGALNGTSGICYALQLDIIRNKLYVGGLFSNVSDARGVNILTVNNIASWDLSKNKWDGVGSFYNNGTNGVIISTVYDSCKNIIYCGGTFTTVYDASNIQLTANNIAAWNINGSFWTLLGTDSSYNGLNTTCNALAMDSSNQILYVGGAFTTARSSLSNTINPQYVALWNNNTKSWSTLGGLSSATNGLDNSCNTMVYDSVNQQLYVGGVFTKVKDGIQTDPIASKIAIWNVSTNMWSTTGGVTATTNGLVSASAVCSTLTLDRKNNCIYVGGTFTTVRDNRPLDITMNNIAKWDISRKQWVGFGGYSSNGTNNYIYAYSYDSSNNVVYCGGSFTAVNDSSNIQVTANYIAAWNINGQYWTLLGRDPSNNGTSGTVRTLDIDVSNQMVYVGGLFSTVKDSRLIDISINNVAAWDIRKQQWSGIGGYSSNGTNGVINAYAYDNSNNIIYCGGNFTQVYDLSNIVLSANNIAIWNITGQYWSPLGTPTSNGTNGAVKSLFIDISNQSLYVGGSTFTVVRDSRVVDITMNNVAKWNIATQQWNGLGGYSSNGTNGTIYSYIYDNSNNIVYCGGNFTQVYDSSNIILNANDVAIWNISGQSWSLLGTPTSNGTNGYVRTLAMDTNNQILYVGGQFNQVKDNTVNVTANNIAMWNLTNKKWSLLGSIGSNGMDASVNTIVYSNNKLYVGGEFKNVSDSTGTKTANYFVVWDASMNQWVSVNGAMNGSCKTIIINSVNNELYVGGSFTTITYGSTVVTFNNIASLNLNTYKWNALGGNVLYMIVVIILFILEVNSAKYMIHRILY